MRALRVLTTTVLTVALLTVTAYAVGWGVSRTGPTSAATAPTVGGTPTPTPAPAPSEAAPTAEPQPEPFLLEPGDRGMQVRELQARLFQLAWLPELTTGRYDAATEQAVRGFQRKRGIEATGTTDARTWDRLVAMTEEPTRDQLLNVLRPGPAVLAAGASGDAVRDLQARLVEIAWLFGEVTGRYDAATVEAVEGFQAKRGIPVTGEVDRRTLDRLEAMTQVPTYEAKHNIVPEPGALDPRCRTGRVICIDKSTSSLRWVVDGQVLRTIDVRFGSEELPTREGAFTVYRMSRDHVSSLYGTSMPFAMFFSGGQAVHYSPDFAANGYNGASHGCVNVRDYDEVAALFDEVRVGDEVVVYWS